MRNLEKAALCGEPSYVWRDGQRRRFGMIIHSAGDRAHGDILDNGCGIGMYLQHLRAHTSHVYGLEYDRERAREAGARLGTIVRAAGEHLPFPPSNFDLLLSHEVLEHVDDDRLAMEEISRVLRTPDSEHKGGRLVLFVPNRGYPFETHGIYWRGRYRFGNIPLVNYLPRPLRNRLAPHVRVYSVSDLRRLIAGLPLKVIEQTIIFGAYDNIIARAPSVGKFLRGVLQALERTPLKCLGLSHYWVLEKTNPGA
ncbi:MAG: class I SAM-dependent methyltransferase [Anaerolineales bacterium]|nr:class I SAM-dependent methyltransferase [Anaerolineales bacterium]